VVVVEPPIVVVVVELVAVVVVVEPPIVVVVVEPPIVVVVVELVAVVVVVEPPIVVVVVELVAVVVELVLVVGLVVVELLVVGVELVVVVTPHAGSVGSVQEQSAFRQFARSSLRHALKAAAFRPGHAAAISSLQTFGLHSFVAAAGEAKTPAPSATAANVTTALMVIVEPSPVAVPMLRSMSSLCHRVPVFDTPVKTKKSRSDAEKSEAPGSRRTRGIRLRA
jgi:hypothetical protein